MQDKLPDDVALVPGGDERALARHHTRLLRPDDVIVYDRGYVSRALLAHHIDNGLHAVFRIRRQADTHIDQIIRSDLQDTDLTLTAKTSDTEPRRIRVIKAPASPWILVTTLLNAQTYSPQSLADLYHQRWSIEELDKTVKQTLTMEAFHAQSLRGVQQELTAGLTLIALARLMSNDCERLINGSDTRQTRGGLRANQKNALTAVFAGFEDRLLTFTHSCATFVSNAMARIADGMQPDRTHRTYHRVSQKPIGKWKPPKPS